MSSFPSDQIISFLEDNLCDINAENSACTEFLEQGKLLYFPHLGFPLQEEKASQIFGMAESCENVSYDLYRDELKGFKAMGSSQVVLRKVLQRYAHFSFHLVKHLFPQYKEIKLGCTSFRPVEIAGRVIPCYRKDDKKLHIDAFPTIPSQGQRILRIFSNINPHGQLRIWQVGEPFEKVLAYFGPRLNIPFALKKYLLLFLNLTRGLRTDYDDLMLQLHNAMKADEAYQRRAVSPEINFAPNSTWIAFTDQLSHAALAGQFCLEQTFLLPVENMINPELSPLKQLEHFYNSTLV